jgi:hypothetical protein
MEDNTRKIPLALRFPKGIGDLKDARIFIYFPKKGFALEDGKLFEAGLWSLAPGGMKKNTIIAPFSAEIFQFLVIVKPASSTEAVANAYFRDGALELGPFVSADYSIGRGSVSLSIQSFTRPKDMVFEIEGVPENAGLTKGRALSDTAWTLSARDAKSVELVLPRRDAPKKLVLSVNAFDPAASALISTFTLIINLGRPDKPFAKKYREVRIDAKKLLKDEGVKCDRYLLSVRCPGEMCCVKGGMKLEDKWLLPNNGNAEIAIRNFDPALDRIDLTADFMAVRERPYEIENHTKKLPCDFGDAVEETKDFSSCIGCRSHARCPMFEGFMDYIGSTTILRHLLSDLTI